MHFADWRIVAIILTVSTLVLPGCAKSTPARFYMLTSVVGPQADPSVESGRTEMSLAIGPLQFPEYLDRPQIVTRASQNRLDLAEFHRWAEPLKQLFPRVLAENLSSRLSTERIVVRPWQSARPVDYRVRLNVIRFDGTPGGEVSLIARWALLGPDGKELSPPRRSRIAVPTRQTGYEGVAVAMSEAVGELAREIAAVLGSVSESQGAED